jgi:hypothetical protein
MNLPDKPEAVTHVSDALWEAALKQVTDGYCITVFDNYMHPKIIDHARCLILLNEVAEPVDPLRQLWREFASHYDSNTRDAYLSGAYDEESEIKKFTKVVGDYVKGLKP